MCVGGCVRRRGDREQIPCRPIITNHNKPSSPVVMVSRIILATKTGDNNEHCGWFMHRLRVLRACICLDKQRIGTCSECVCMCVSVCVRIFVQTFVCLMNRFVCFRSPNNVSIVWPGIFKQSV